GFATVRVIEEVFFKLIEDHGQSAAGGTRYPRQKVIQRHVRVDAGIEQQRGGSNSDLGLEAMQESLILPFAINEHLDLVHRLQVRDDAGLQDRSLADATCAVQDGKGRGEQIGGNSLTFFFAPEEVFAILLVVGQEPLIRAE